MNSAFSNRRSGTFRRHHRSIPGFKPGWLVAIGLTMGLWAFRCLAGQIEGQLSFSIDGGKAFVETLPTLPVGQKLEVRADWVVTAEDRPIKDNIVLTRLCSEEGDFASANVGQQMWDEKKAWYQRPDPYYCSRERQAPFVYHVDFGARAEGEMGQNNRWDAEAGKYVDGPLPGIGALLPGKHSFEIQIWYRVVGEEKPILLKLPFEVVIEGGAAQAGTKGKDLKAVSAAPRPDPSGLPDLRGLQVWDARQWRVAGGGPALKEEGPFVSPGIGQEIAMRLERKESGEYYLRALVESGAREGEEELNRPTPFFYLNGEPIHFSRAGPVVPFGKTHVAIMESAAPVRVEPGDELRWNTEDRPGKLVGGIALAAQPMALAPIDIRPFYDPYFHDAFRISGAFGFANPEGPLAAAPEVGKDQTDTPEGVARGTFKAEIFNTSGRAGEFETEIVVLDYWQRPLARKTQTVSLGNREKGTLESPFFLDGSDRYRAIVRVKGARGFEREEVVENLVNSPHAARPRLWLNDDWQWTSQADNKTLATRTIGSVADAEKQGDWKKASLPHSWEDPKQTGSVAWYRREFEVPAWMGKKRLFLHFSRVAYEGRIFLNGREIGSHFGGVSAFEKEITEAIRPGRNELLLGVRDSIAALEPEELSASTIDLSSRARYRAPGGGRKGGLGEVWLYAAGNEPIRDVFVKTSFREKKIRLEIEPPILSGEKTAILSNRLLFEGREVLKFPDVVVKDPKADVIKLEQSWPDPILWNPGEPKLLQLVTEWKTENGAVLDRMDTRFGFREFRTDGSRLVWNGIPVKLASIPFLNTWGVGLNHTDQRDSIRKVALMAKRLGAKMERHIYDPEHHADINDEEGIVMAKGGNAPSGPTRQKVDSDEYWQNAAESAVAMIKGERNHPSIVTWYLSNEFDAANDLKNRERLQALGKAALDVDDTRLLEFGCDLDLGGFASIVSTHYPVDVHALREEKGVMPEAAYWRFFGTPLKPGEQVPAGIIRTVANVRSPSPIVWGLKPLVINETLWNYFFAPPDGLTRLAGDAVYSSPSALEQAYKEGNRWLIRGHRDAEASVVTPWEWISRDPLRLEMPEVEINPIQRYAHFYEGEKVPFDVNLHYDKARKADLEFVWRLLRESREIVRTEKKLAFEPAELKRERVDLTMPKVSTRTAYRLVMELNSQGKTVKRIELPIQVFPHAPIAFPKGVRMGLFDPEGQTRRLFKSFAGTPPATVEHLDVQSLSGVKVLILGRNAACADDPAQREALARFAEAGGRLLVLSQEASPALLPLSLQATRLVSNQLWTFRKDHPFLRGLQEGDFANWFPSNQTGHNLYLKPEAGNFRTVLESGGPKGMIYAALMECPLGNGLLVASQLDLAADLEKNPIAAQLWRNLLGSMARPLAASPKTGLWAGGESGFSKTLKRLGTVARPVNGTGDLDGLDLLLLDGGLPLSAAETSAIHGFVENGGRLMIHGTSPESRENATAICGTAIRVLASAPPSWNGRAVRLGPNPWTEGLTNYDLFWKRRPDSENYSPTYFSKSSTLSPLGEWSLEADGGAPLLYPAYLLELPVGAGRVFLDNVEWDRQTPVTRAIQQRVAATLLTNLGVRLEAGRPVQIPANLAYRPVDLSSVLNRAFADEVAGDGKGGWTDQGPDADLRCFPMEPEIQTFHEVPFRIGKGKSVLVLASQYRPKGPPESVDLPVSGHADALFFLQSSAWTSAIHHASLVVHYTDGSDYEIRLVGNLNLRDWSAANAAEAFVGETDTGTRHAWGGASKEYSSVNLYTMAWPNPHPEREIRGVTFKSMNQGVPILVGVTVGLKKTLPEPGKIATAQAGTVEARRLVKEGRARLAEGKTEDAAAQFRAATQADGQWDTPYLELAHVYGMKREWAKAIETYATLVETTPDHLEALFGLGKAYEEAGQWDKAEQTYRRSLEVNANQPEVLTTLNALNQKRQTKP